LISNFSIGNKKTFTRLVRDEDTVHFPEGHLHPFYSTYAITRDAEWSSRLFVKEMIEEDEQGLGTFVNVKHVSPALIGEEVFFEAVIEELDGNKISCSFTAKVGDRLIAEGRTGQMILKKEKIEGIVKSLKK